MEQESSQVELTIAPTIITSNNEENENEHSTELVEQPSSEIAELGNNISSEFPDEQTIGDRLETSGDDGDGLTGHAGESDAVTIARIEAERDVTISSIHADTEQQRIDGTSETLVEEIIETKSEVELCREEIASLQAKLEILEANILIPPAPLEPEQMIAEETPKEALETVEEQNLTPQSIATPTTETQTEVSEENAVENQEQPKVRRKYIPI
jgi:hypothetical protein